MRDTRDRIRHSILFELIGLIAVTPLGSLIFDVPIGHFGVVAVVSTTIAMLWNYVYNLGFDHALLALFKDVRKTLTIRIVHAVLFEVGLICLLVPFIAWYLASPGGRPSSWTYRWPASTCSTPSHSIGSTMSSSRCR